MRQNTKKTKKEKEDKKKKKNASHSHSHSHSYSLFVEWKENNDINSTELPKLNACIYLILNKTRKEKVKEKKLGRQSERSKCTRNRKLERQEVRHVCVRE